MSQLIIKHKNHIAFCGCELEGYWYNGHDNIKQDSSVEGFSYDNDDFDCNGECRDNCDCNDYCECEECLTCDLCSDELSNCNCEECYFCNDCDNNLNQCECIAKSICDKKTCNKLDICEECQDSFNELQNIERSCRLCHNTQRECYMECNCECSCECNCQDSRLVGEVSSKKLKVNEIKDWILNNYPNEVNSTCGFHIHLSFLNDKQDYSVIATKRFYDYFLSQIRLWADKRNINKDSRFYKRLNGVQYSNNEFKADIQITENSDRYTHINYAYNKFSIDNNNGTVEIRLATMFDDKNITVEYALKVIDIFNGYLSINKPKVFKFTRFVKLNNSYNFRLDMDIKHKEKGIEIYVKSDKFNKLYDVNQDDIITEYHGNYKMQFFNSMLNHITQDNSFNSLKVFDSENNIFMPNMTFLKLKGLNNGQKFFISGLYTENMINEYLDLLNNSIDNFVKEFC
tara:strand:- start:156 stop:1526 length:1371 start_codon:yes stop_codon:yes gene_type:complete